MSQKGYIIHPPSHGGNNDKMMFVSFNKTISIYEYIFVPNIYEIILQTNLSDLEIISTKL